MKNLKKIASLVLALVMVFSLAITVSAAETYTITIDNSSNENASINGKTYSAYKVFDLTLGDATTSEGVTTYGAYSYSIKSTDWAWTTLTTGATTNDDTGVITTKYGIVLTPSADHYIVDGETMTSANARALADALASALPSSADGTSAAAANETATISLNTPGYYAVYGTVVPKDPENGTDDVVAALALTTTDPTAKVVPKVEVPTIDKKITGEHVLDDNGKAATAQVGKTVSFQIDSNVPDLTGYSAYTFTITDTMSSGLTFTTPSDVVVKINDQRIDTAEIATVGQTLTVTIPYNTLKAATKGQAIVVTYSAVVNNNALTTDYENNTAYLTYSRKPGTTETNDTPEKTVYVIDADINVDKVANSAGGAKLAGAEFKVFKGATTPADGDSAWYKWDSTNKLVTWVAKADADTFTTNADGKFTTAVQGLEAEKTGTSYGLLETKAPTGYNLLDEPVIVTLKGAYTASNGTETAEVTATGATVTNGTVNLSVGQNAKQPLATTQVINESGAVLPSTGGMGTTLFYVFGGILVAAAVVLLVTKKRVGEAK